MPDATIATITSPARGAATSISLSVSGIAELGKHRGASPHQAPSPASAAKPSSFRSVAALPSVGSQNTSRSMPICR